MHLPLPLPLDAYPGSHHPTTTPKRPPPQWLALQLKPSRNMPERRSGIAECSVYAGLRTNWCKLPVLARVPPLHNFVWTLKYAFPRFTTCSENIMLLRPKLEA
jgi:hypothetical protein